MLRELFEGDNGKLSSKRIIGTILLAVALVLLIDAHFTDRTLNNNAFSSLLYTGGVMIVGGVLEGKFTSSEREPRRKRYYRKDSEDKHPLE